ncbi:MAG: MFS transporter [Acetobacteraceae bacterium]|nr:MFS transporter [Acetobacteraceae bacterium]
MSNSRWLSVGGSLMVGLFVAYLDRINLSVGLPAVSRDLGFAGDQFGVVSSWVLTTFLIGYCLANVLGGILTRRYDPKTTVMWCVAIWSVSTVLTGLAGSVAVLLFCRLILGVTEGIYWPQQSRFAKGWFAPSELARANSLIQYYGQFLALAIGFMIMTPVYDALGWKMLFYITGGIGLVLILPLYAKCLRPESEAPYIDVNAEQERGRLTFKSLGGVPFLFLIFTYITQGMLFWGITLWIPLVMRSIGFTGWGQAIASSVPYLAAVILAIPMSMISDRTGKRVLIAALGMLIPGVLLILLPTVDSGIAKLALITVALGYYASSFTPNIWAIIQETVEPQAIGPASGIINGLGAGGGGTLAGFLVGLLYRSTGSYMAGFVALGTLVILGGISLLIYGRIAVGVSQRREATPPTQLAHS